MVIYCTEDQSGPSARITFCADTRSSMDKHRFEAWVEGQTGFVEYQETQTARGKVRVADPPEKMYRRVIQSESVTKFFEKHNATDTKRLRPGP